ncbi:MAG: 2-hydroxyacid dehydrogenase [Burkholderiales bacterium]
MAGKFKVGITRDVVTKDGTIFGTEALKVLDDPAIEWEFLPEDVKELTVEHAARYDALGVLSPKVTRATVSGANRRLKLVARFGVGYDSVDVPACTENDVILTTTPNGVRRPVAASVIGSVLALAHRMVLKDRLVREGRWGEKGNFLGMGLVGRTFGVIGVGNIGAEVLRLAQPFGLKLMGCDPHIAQSAITALGATPVDKETLLKSSDFISVNTFLDETTRGLIGAREFALMKPTAYFINTSRGPVVDEKALIDTLKNRRIAGAAVDVFEQEPVSPDNPLLNLDNVLLAPHAICHTDECFTGIGMDAFRSAVDIAHGRRPKGVVNSDVLKHPAWQGKLHA